MSRSGYSDDLDVLDLGRWRGQVASSIRGKRGQAFLKDLLAALDSLPEKALIAEELVTPEGDVCALGAIGKARGLDMNGVDVEDRDKIAEMLGVTHQLVREASHSIQPVLDCDSSDLFTESGKEYIAFIGLNPSIADEHKLDPTLTRIRNFARQFKFQRFIMLNLFALVSTDPKLMLIHPDPVGPENDEHIRAVASRSSATIACWGSHGKHLKRDEKVLEILSSLNVKWKLKCLGETDNGSPKHPLYLAGNTKLIDYPVATM